MSQLSRYSLIATATFVSGFILWAATRPVLERQFQAAIPPQDPVSTIRSITWYDINGTPPSGATLTAFRNDLSRIRAAGFSTIWLVSPWRTFNPHPLASPPVYNEQAFADLRVALDALRGQNMKAILPLNYLGPGWEPTGIDTCTWLSNPTMYATFETYVREYLTRLQSYSDMVYIMVFTEGSEPCNLQPYYPPNIANAHALAQLIRQTLGSLPSRLPPSLRSQFKIGYHDYTLVNLDWGQGQYPLAIPVQFDFVSMVAYGMEQWTDAQIDTELSTRSGRFRNLYPATPLIFGEYGASSCMNGSTDTNQSRVVSRITNFTIDNRYGLNLWGWRPGPPNQECTNPVYGGLAITNQDGTLKPVVTQLRSILNPRVTAAGITTSYQPWAVWVQGKNITRNILIRLWDSGVQWGGDITPVIASDFTWLSFQLPTNSPPSNCNATTSCTIQLRLLDRVTGLRSAFYPLTLPPAISPTPPSPPPPPPPPPPSSPSSSPPIIIPSPQRIFAP